MNQDVVRVPVFVLWLTFFLDAFREPLYLVPSLMLPIYWLVATFPFKLFFSVPVCSVARQYCVCPWTWNGAE